MKKIARYLWFYVKKMPFVDIAYKRLYWEKKNQRMIQTHNEEITTNGYSYIELLNNVLQDKGMLYFVISGTLLGLIRDKRFIKWDDDIDFGICISNESDWKELEKYMNQSGLKKIREFGFDGRVTEQTYLMNKITVDFFGVFNEDNYSLSYSYDFIEDENYNSIDEMSVFETILPKINGIDWITICETQIPIPDCPEKVLSAIYNEDWMVPNPNWKANSGKCCKLLKNKVGIREVF